MNHYNWSNGVQCLLTDEEYYHLQRDWNRYCELKRKEAETKRADMEIFDLEDAFGEYRWLIRRIVTGEIE